MLADIQELDSGAAVDRRRTEQPSSGAQVSVTHRLMSVCTTACFEIANYPGVAHLVSYGPLTDCFWFAIGTGASLVEISAEQPRKPLAQRIAAIRAAFGLSHSELSELLQVTRSTLYEWIDPASGQQPQKTNEARIERLTQLAEYWTGFTDFVPGKDLRRLLAGGRSVYELLGANTETRAEACAAMRELARLLRDEARSKPTSRAERLRGLGFGAQEKSALDQLVR